MSGCWRKGVEEDELNEWEKEDKMDEDGEEEYIESCGLPPSDLANSLD